MAGKTSGVKYTPSLVVGLLLVPVSAVAAFALVSGQSAQVDSTLAAAETTAPATVAVVETAEQAVPSTSTAPEVDLEAACGEDGLSLVEAEANETITELEKAALDALRPICAEAGMELPGPPAPAPVIRTVTVSSGGGGTAAPAGGDDSGGTHDDDHDEDGEHDEDEEDDDHGGGREDDD